ncbi:hypothetical protein RHO13_12115 [Orbus wheelerorum]|uniref:T6SS immunity protein Tli3 family protein n=1 Tax=Orbus wheelerorum TaxID=3074111 RepID=UPI00370D4E01
MKRIINIALVFLVILPAAAWLVVVAIGSILPEKTPPLLASKMPPLAQPRQGYEIIYPYSSAMGLDKGSFYYVSNKRQVVYRYDTHRYLELQGENCEGLIWYHDEAKNIHTRIDGTFFTVDKLPKFEYFNPGKNYIALPTQDLSAVMFSLDGGKSFTKAKVTSYAAVPGEQVERFIGTDDKPLTLHYTTTKENNVFEKYQKPITISGNTGYFILNNGDILFGATINHDSRDSLKFGIQRYHSLSSIIEKQDIDADYDFGSYWQIYHNAAYIERIESAKNIKVEPYQGWDRIRCEVGAER